MASTVAVVAVVGVLALGSQLPRSADAALDPFVPYDALTDPELAELRGGFSFGGTDFDIAIDIIFRSFVNEIGLVSVLKFNQKSGILANNSTFFPGPNPDDGQSVEVVEDEVKTTLTTETTVIVHELTPKTFKSIVETSGNNQNIINSAQLDISIPSTLQAALDSFSKNILSNTIGAQIGLLSIF